MEIYDERQPMHTTVEYSDAEEIQTYYEGRKCT